MAELICMLGLPGSGKTSFLAALYELVSHDDIEGSPKLVALPPDRAYLQDIHERWLRCEAALRTKDTGPAAAIHFDLETGDAETFSVAIPDVAGGAVRTLWEERRWTNGLDELARTASDVMLFLRADDIEPPKRVREAIDHAAVEEPRADGDDEREVPRIAFNPENSPTQVKLVDLLQSVAAINPTRPLGLAVVLSAWDRVQDQDVGPLELMQLRLPLLWQFLTANSETITFRAFGVSAQGGDFQQDADVRRLLSTDPPSSRTIVVDGEQVSNDISRPLRWLWQRI